MCSFICKNQISLSKLKQKINRIKNILKVVRSLRVFFPTWSQEIVPVMESNCKNLMFSSGKLTENSNLIIFTLV